VVGKDGFDCGDAFVGTYDDGDGVCVEERKGILGEGEGGDEGEAGGAVDAAVGGYLDIGVKFWGHHSLSLHRWVKAQEKLGNQLRRFEPR